MNSGDKKATKLKLKEIEQHLDEGDTGALLQALDEMADLQALRGTHADADSLLMTVAKQPRGPKRRPN